jgi:SAM-dependent methyltransferase
LDVGCAFGWDLAALSNQAAELIGIDVNEASLQQARETYPQCTFFNQSATDLSFPAGYFDVVILSEVIEHVGEENKQAVVDEVWRVLKPNGRLIFTAPFDGLTAWADPLDFKRRHPSMYRLYMRLSNYKPKTELEVGHQHVSLDEINILFDGRFDFVTINFCGFFSPFITWILTIGERTGLFGKTLVRRLNRFRDWEDGVPYPEPLAYNVRLVARKKSGRPNTVAANNAHRSAGSPSLVGSPSTTRS